MNHSIKLMNFIATTIFLVSCGSNEPKTLASLKYEPEKETALIKDDEIKIEKLSHEEVRQEYRELLDFFEEDALKEKIERRIADVHMMEGVFEHNKAEPKASYYAEATQAYREILEKYPNSPGNAEVLYQLSKAYDIEGKQEESLDALTRLTRQYPNYLNITEAYFRKGDIHFSNQQYKEAQRAYSAVVKADNENLDLNAHYMLGWSHYKQLNYDQSINSFAYVLNQLLAGRSSIEGLGKKEKPLATDSISSISLAFDKVGGAKEIDAVPLLAGQDYIWMIYDNLGQYYLSKELYEESASTFRLYVTKYSNSDRAPDLHVKLINTYVEGGFTQQSLIEKESYVNAYGIGAAYYADRRTMASSIKTSLKIYLSELAGHFHSKGQLHQKEIAELDNKTSIAKAEKDEKLGELYSVSVSSFDKAADFYSKFAQTFPDASNIDEIYFLKAETLFSAYRYPQAIADYERVAYRPKGVSARSNEVNAGYAAIISYEKYIDVLRTGFTYPGKAKSAPLSEDSVGIKEWKQKAVDSMLVFAEKFHYDKRSPAVLNNAAEYLFALDQYENTINVANGLIDKNPQLDKELKKTAYGLIASSHFKLENYPKAEENYINQRALVTENTEEYSTISERLAVSIYKESEVMIARDDPSSAIDQLLKVKRFTPNSSIRVTAQYDAAVLLLEATRWDEAITELLELNQAYPEDKLAVEFPRKLAFAYEKSEAWENAGRAYIVLVNNDPDPVIRQEALFLAATMFEEDTNYAESIKYFKNYVDRYQQPFDNYLEAVYHIAVNYEKLDDQKQQNVWLTKLINVDSGAGSERTDRSRWLAAWANTKYGDYYSSLFAEAQLTQPIVKSIPNKNKWLQSASSRYQAAADYGILEFVSMSSYKIGILYRQFASDLRSAPKPNGLSASDQQVYAEIIEEQARPFDQLAIDLHQANIDRAWAGKFNDWISKSFAEMQVLRPARFNKKELIVSYGNGIY
ncbi:MAG: tetratricopeptide repeat protein [Cellvibrionaceae bacterium]